MNFLGGSVTTMTYYTPIAVNVAGISLTSVALTNIINVTESGKISAIGVYVATPVSGTPLANLEIQVDGQTTQTLAFFTGVGAFSAELGAWGSLVSGPPGNTYVIPVGLPYQISCRVGLNVSQAGAGGTFNISVMRGKAI